MTEAQFKTDLMADLRRVYPGGFFFRMGAGAFQRSGLPDIAGILDGRFIGIEAKKPGKYVNVEAGLSPVQRKAKQLIEGAEGIYIVADDAKRCIQQLAYKLGDTEWESKYTTRQSKQRT